jgi:cytoskeletal protein CcmA (bactofilin family)
MRMSENLLTKETVLEEGTEFDGSIRSKCPIRVSGTLKGDVSAPSLNITPSGSVYGQVKVTELKSEGVIAGEIDAQSVALSGQVSDKTIIRASSLQVTLGQNGSNGKLQVAFGSCELEIGGPTVPDKSLLTERGKKHQLKNESMHVKDESMRTGINLNSGPALET